MPAGRRLAAPVDAGVDVSDGVRRVALLVRFFTNGPRRPQRSRRRPRWMSVRRNWEDSFRQMAPFGGSVLDREMTTTAERLARR